MLNTYLLHQVEVGRMPVRAGRAEQPAPCASRWSRSRTSTAPRAGRPQHGIADDHPNLDGWRELYRFGTVTLDEPVIFLDVRSDVYPVDVVRALAAELIEAADVLEGLR